MPDISQLITEDSRTPIQKLRRCQLWKLADVLGVQYPQGAPKTTMLDLFKALDVDPTKATGDIEWAVVHPSFQAQQAAALFGTTLAPQLVPVNKPHASARKGVNADMVLSQRIAQQDTDKFEQKRIEALERDNERVKALEEENARLKEIIEKRLSALETQKPAEPSLTGPNASQREYWKAYRQAKSLGLDVKRGMTRDEIESLIRTAEQ